MKLSLIASTTLAIFLAGFVRADSLTWNNLTSGAWNDGANWAPALAAPTANDVAVLDNSGTAQLASGVVGTYGSLTMGNGEVDLSGGMLSGTTARLAATAGSNAVASVTSGTWNNTGNLYVGDSGTGALTVSGGLVNVSGTVFTGNTIGSRGTITLSGSGVLAASRITELSGSGTLSLTGGTLRALKDESDFLSGFESGDVTLLNLHFDTNGFNVGIATKLNGSSLYKDGAGTLSLGGTAAFIGATRVTSGTLRLDYSGPNSGTNGVVILDAGTLDLAGHNLAITSVTGSSGAIVTSSTSGTATLTITQGSGIFAGRIQNGSGVVSLAMNTGGGTVVLTGSNSYTGGTSIKSGVLELRAGGSINDPSGALVLGGTSTGPPGQMALTGGIYSGSTARLGTVLGSLGRIVMQSGTFTNSGNFYLGDVGRGDISATGGLMTVSGTIFSARGSSSAGFLSLAHSTTSQAVLETSRIVRGSGTSSTISFDAGTLRALADQGDFLSGYQAGDVTIKSGGAILDTNGHTVGISAQISGTGGMTKQGAGTLTLSGSNTYSGGTTIASGTLAVAHNSALGSGGVNVASGLLAVQSGVTVSNDITLSGGSYHRALSGSTSLANAVDATSSFAGGNADTSATILDGTLSSSSTLQTTFVDSSSALNDQYRLSDVYRFQGTGSDVFVLQLSVTSVDADSFLAYLDANGEWVNAVFGNSGGASHFVAGAYDSALDFHLGYYGVDATTHSVWAVINHNSDYSAVPEPATNGLLVFALGAVAAGCYWRWPKVGRV